MMSKHIVVTGGNSGIGKALCQQLVEKGCYVFLGARSDAKGQDAVADIQRATGKTDSIEHFANFMRTRAKVSLEL